MPTIGLLGVTWARQRAVPDRGAEAVDAAVGTGERVTPCEGVEAILTIGAAGVMPAACSEP